MLRNYFILLAGLLVLFAAPMAWAVTLSSGQTNYVTSADITSSGVGISSALVGTSAALDKITNLHVITTGNSGTTSSAYGIKVTGNYNQATNSNAIYTTGNSGRGISVANNSIVINQGVISTAGTSSYGIYGGGNSNSISNSGSINTVNSSSYGIYLNGDNNSASNSGAINTKVYGIYGDGNANQISNLGNITTSNSSSAHGIYVSAGTASSASASTYSVINNSGVINSSGNGIYNKDSYSQITNLGTINTAVGTSIYGIRNEGDNAIINNSGSVTSSNYALYNSGANVVINNSGNLVGNVRIGNGVLNISGGNISGTVDGVDRAGSVNILSNFNQNTAFNNLDNLTIASGVTLNSAAVIDTNKIMLGNNSVLNLQNDAAAFGAIGGASNGVGSLNINGIEVIANNIGGSGNALANLNINSGSLLSVGDIYANNIFVNGNLDLSLTNNLNVFGNVLGSGVGLINVGAQNQNISENFTLNNGDSLAVSLKNGGVGNLTVGGNAIIDANAKLLITTSQNQGFIADGTHYNLISSNSTLTNPINNISVNGNNSNQFGLLKFSTLVVNNNLVLNINRLTASEVTTNQNSQNIYQSLLDAGGSGGGELLSFEQYLDNSGLSGEELDAALNQLAPNSSKAALMAINNVMNNSTAIIESRLEKINFRKNEDPLKESIWYQGFGGATNQDAIKDDEGFKINSTGFALGGDRKVSRDITLGASFGVVSSGVRSADNNKKTAINTYQFNLYGSKIHGKYFTDVILGLGINSFNSTRTIAILNSNAAAKYYGQTYALKIKTGVTNNLEHGFNITPEMALNFLHNNISAYNETGADDLNLRVGAVSANFLEMRGGLNFGHNSRIYNLPEFKKMVSAFKISYGYALLNDAPTTNASFVSQNSNFSSRISHIDNSSLRAGLELFLYHKSNSIISADYNFEHKTTSNSHFILFKIREEF